MITIDKFKALSPEKQKTIIEAGFRCFGELGYKKASTADLANAAGISKGMIFHYFGTKKEMYLFLVERAASEIVAAISDREENASQDFFDRVIQMSRDKLSFLKKYPSLLSFFMSLYKEKDPELTADIRDLQKQGDITRREFVLHDIDRKKFKDSVNPELLMDLIIGYSLGVVNQLSAERHSTTLTEEEMNMILNKLTDIMQMLKVNFYKEEYLK